MRSEVNPMRSIPILLDGDPGHDDAIAWMLANASPRLEIRAVTSVSGNQTIEKTTYNALRVMALLGIDAPMAKGRPGPLVSEPMVAPSVHGETGWTARPCRSRCAGRNPSAPWSRWPGSCGRAESR